MKNEMKCDPNTSHKNYSPIESLYSSGDLLYETSAISAAPAQLFSRLLN